MKVSCRDQFAPLTGSVWVWWQKHKVQLKHKKLNKIDDSFDNKRILYFVAGFCCCFKNPWMHLQRQSDSIDGLYWSSPSAAAMSLNEPTSDSTPFFSDDSEAEGAEEQGGAAEGQRSQEESPSGVSSVRALLTVFILCYINLLNYMDRFTVAGTTPPDTETEDVSRWTTRSHYYFIYD